jgi:type II restriction enzyme
MTAIPATAKIPIIRNGVVRPIKDVITQYQKVYSLQTKSVKSRGWLMDTLHLIERLDTTFSLNQLYAFENELKLKHPDNNHIPDKIRQQLQFLRDKGIIEFKGGGQYKKL